MRLVIEGRDATEPLLNDIVGTAPGQPLSMVQVREAVAHLFSLGRFEGVSVDATLEDGRVALRYDLVPIHPVSRVRFAGPLGVPGIDEGALRRAILDRYGTSPPLSRSADMTRIVADALRERGYLRASITPRAEIEHDPERATLVFTIDPGARTRIGAVEVLGPPAERAEVLDRLGLTPGAPYQREALGARIERYAEERRKRGYYEAKIVPSVRLGEGDLVADLTLTVTPGPRVRVVFTGDPLPSDQRAELVPVEREGSVDEDLLEDSSNRIEEYLRAQGYRDAKAPHTPRGRERRAGHHLRRDARPAVQGGDVRDLGQRVGAAGRIRGRPAAARRPAVLVRQAGRGRPDDRGPLPPARLRRRESAFGGRDRHGDSARRRRCRWPCARSSPRACARRSTA